MKLYEYGDRDIVDVHSFPTLLVFFYYLFPFVDSFNVTFLINSVSVKTEKSCNVFYKAMAY